jgi:hypothetical protein
VACVAGEGFDVRVELRHAAVAVSRQEAATAAVAMKTTGELQQLRQLQVKMEEA